MYNIPIIEGIAPKPPCRAAFLFGQNELKIILKENDLLEAARQLSGIKDGMPKLIQMAVNKVLPGVRTDTVKVGRQIYTLSAKQIRSMIGISKANARYGRMEGRVYGNYKPIPLIKFPHIQGFLTKASGKRGAYRRVSAQVMKQGGMKYVKTGWIATVSKNQYTGIFARKGKTRFPTKQLYGPSMASLVRKPQVQRVVKPKAQERLTKEVTRATNYLLIKNGIK